MELYSEAQEPTWDQRVIRRLETACVNSAARSLAAQFIKSFRMEGFGHLGYNLLAAPRLIGIIL